MGIGEGERKGENVKEMGAGKHGGKSFHGDWGVTALSLMIYFRDPEGSA